jgi:hypothetical protein
MGDHIQMKEIIRGDHAKSDCVLQKPMKEPHTDK